MIRGIGLRGAVAVNVITMIGIGPLITIPLVLANLHGSVALVAWVVGAIIALCDGLAWAELGSLYPGSGGTYVFLREAFGRERWGRLLAFLFSWQIVLSAPLLLASGYIGFAQYAAYLWPSVGSSVPLQGIVGALAGVVTLVLLYRSIGVVGKLGIGLAGIAVATLAAVIAASLGHFSTTRAISADPHLGFAAALGPGLGPALVLTLYDYYGYGQSSTISDEVRNPVRVLPLSVVLSIALVGVLYLALQIGVLGAIPWTELVATTPNGSPPPAAMYVASTVVERVWGSLPARIVTVAILITAFASTFGNLLGYSRIPYAAATDGLFFRAFAKLDERGRFPNVSLAVVGLLALPLCFLPLGDVIAALTAGLVVIQNIAQLVAVASLRVRGIRAPYRMWLFPLPALVACAGWVYIFVNSGEKAIAFGILSLVAGVAAFLIRSRVVTQWPFAIKAGVLLLGFATLAALGSQRADAAPTWGHAATIERDGHPVFEVDGKPFFVYGAAFFYERLPRETWDSSMDALRGLGINTLDLYVPWNWHELSDGDFDFDGRTSPRRDLDEVLRLAKVHGFKILLRPGPVVRNEWRNGGYPAWLLSRPEYGMPLHDLLEGRYPPTATLQNQHSDDAAAQWMQNATHVKYAKRWLQRVLAECSPYADRILAVALDDDQGAYIDNQTYPAPHFQAYIRWLRDVVHGVTGPREPVFINTYQMKVTASSPVWAMGNWYQSDAYSIGEHDRAELEFSTSLLHTRPHQPMMASEFQAGWLEQPGDTYPRPADPSNTSLAMATMFGAGVRGIVNFPAQDTLYPAGWEVPFANSFYAWDAAVSYDGRDQPRAVPTRDFGALVSHFGPELAASSPVYDGAIAYLGATYGGVASNDLFSAIASATIEAERACRNAGLSCALVDPNAVDAEALERYPFIVVSQPDTDRRFALRSDISAELAAYVRAGGRLVRSDHPDVPLFRSVSKATRPHAIVEGVTGATFARDTGGNIAGFLSVANYGDADELVSNAVVYPVVGEHIALPPFVVHAHSAIVSPVDLHIRAYASGFAPNDRLIFTDCMPDIDDRASLPRGSAPLQTFPSEFFYFRTNGDRKACSLNLRIAGRRRTIPSTFGGRFNPRGESPFEPGPTDDSYTIKKDNDWRDLDSFIYIRHQDVANPSTYVLHPTAEGVAEGTEGDVYGDGSKCAVLSNRNVAVVVSEDAGGRAFAFIDKKTRRNIFTTVGALRDDVVVEPPLSTSDRIAKYTHQFPAGMFNRAYTTRVLQTGSVASAQFTNDAPDVVPHGATFDRIVTLAPDARAFTVDETAQFAGASASDAQRAVSVNSLAVGDTGSMTTRTVFAPLATAFAAQTTVHVTGSNALGYYDSQTHEFATIAWRAGDVEDATILERDASIVVRLTFARDRSAHLRYGYDIAQTPAEASTLLSAADSAAQHPNVAEKGTPQTPRTP